ncbi:MAG: DUF6934 family protein [Bacteroidia bacterium]
MRNTAVYETNEILPNQTKVQYFFESEGIACISKVIEYSVIDFLGGRAVYNLGFGDYDTTNDTFLDDVNSNNGDLYPVFNTVLNTVPVFFRKFPDAVIMVGGSDSREEFLEICKNSCKKKCTDICKNAHRRIKIYRYFVDKYFDELCQEYLFFGRVVSEGNTFVQYIPSKEYDEILVYRKK